MRVQQFACTKQSKAKQGKAGKQAINKQAAIALITTSEHIRSPTILHMSLAIPNIGIVSMNKPIRNDFKLFDSNSSPSFEVAHSFSVPLSAHTHRTCYKICSSAWDFWGLVWFSFDLHFRCILVDLMVLNKIKYMETCGDSVRTELDVLVNLRMAK